jgi:hypothetical protein
MHAQYTESDWLYFPWLYTSAEGGEWYYFPELFLPLPKQWEWITRYYVYNDLVEWFSTCSITLEKIIDTKQYKLSVHALVFLRDDKDHIVQLLRWDAVNGFNPQPIARIDRNEIITHGLIKAAMRGT